MAPVQHCHFDPAPDSTVMEQASDRMRQWQDICARRQCPITTTGNFAESMSLRLEKGKRKALKTLTGLQSKQAHKS